MLTNKEGGKEEEEDTHRAHVAGKMAGGDVTELLSALLSTDNDVRSKAEVSKGGEQKMGGFLFLLHKFFLCQLVSSISSNSFGKSKYGNFLV